MNFLLIVPKYKANTVFYDFPLGLAYISAAMKRAGLNVACLNLNHFQYDDPADVLAAAMRANKTDVVCTGGLITHYNIIKGLFQAVRQIQPGVINIVGGGLISCEPELVFANLGVDYGVLGEGDITIGELGRAIIEGREPSEVKGIIYRNGAGEVVQTEARGPIEEISSLPWPDYQGLGIERYLDNQLPYDTSLLQVFDEPRVLPMISSRGCPYQCSFCYHPLGNKYRSRTLDDFFGELEYVVNQYDVNGLLIMDELLCHKKERLAEFCERIKPFHIRWMAQLRVDSVNEKLLGMLKDAGCYYLSYGIESAQDEILASMKKHTTVAQIENALDLTYNMGISVQGNLLFSDRSETMETAMASIDWALKHWYHRLQLAPLFALPRSSDYLYAVEKGLIEDRMEYIERGTGFVNISKLNKKEMGTILKICSGTSLNLLLLPEEYEITPVGYDFKREAVLYEMEVKCPHCERFVYYTNICHYEAIFNNRFLHCKYCGGRFDIMLEWFDHFRSATVASGESWLEQAKEMRAAEEQWSEPFRESAVMKAPKKAEHPYNVLRMDAEGVNEEGRRFAILLPLSKVCRKVGMNLGKALAEQGVDACVFEIPGITERLLGKCDKGLLASFYGREGITDTVSINASRRELNVPDAVRHHRLVQGGGEVEASDEGDEFVYETAVAAGLPIATEYGRFVAEPEGEDCYAAEIGVTFDFMVDEPPLQPKNLEAVKPFLNAAKKRLVESQDFSLSFEHGVELLDWAERQIGRKLEGPRDRLVNYIGREFVQSVMKSELLRRLRYVAKRRGWRLKIAGRYWEEVRTFAEYSEGFVGFGEPMARFLQRCKVVVHVHGDNNVQLLDAMGCGAFCVAREHPEEEVRNGWGKCFGDALKTFANDKELEKLLGYYIDEQPGERVALVRAGSAIVRERFSYEALAGRLAAVREACV